MVYRLRLGSRPDWRGYHDRHHISQGGDGITELLLIFVPPIILLFVIAGLCFKISSLHKRISVLNYLIRDMIKAGVSDEAIDLAAHHMVQVVRSRNG